MKDVTHTFTTRCVRVSRLMVCAAALGLGLAGCASVSTLNVQVQSFGQWPAGKTAGGTYAFDRLPSQQSDAVRQGQIEAAATSALSAHGFKATARDEADVWVQVSAQIVQTREPSWGRSGWPGRPDMFSSWYGSQFGFGVDYRPPRYEQQVAVLIRDRRTGESLHEAHGAIEGASASEANWPALFEATLKDFPGPAVSPRTVVVPRPGAKPASGAEPRNELTSTPPFRAS